MRFHLRRLFAYRELLLNWTLRQIRVRYKQSLLGIAWAILQPLSMMLVFTVVFSLFAKIPSDGIPYPIFSYTALLPWTMFATSISFGVPSVVQNMDLVTKVYFPREILPISAVMAAFVDFAVASVVFAALMVHYRVPVTWHLVWVPILLVLQVVLTLGLVLTASAINVFYRDIRFVVPLAMQIWMYATPIIYPMSSVPERLRFLYMVNPMAPIIDGYRKLILFSETPEPRHLAMAALLSLTLCFGGYWYFKRAEMHFADLI